MNDQEQLVVTRNISTSDQRIQGVYRRLVDKYPSEELADRLFKIHKALEAKALRDSVLKKFLNKGGFEAAMEAELKLSKDTGLPVSLLLLDIDEFKRFNDTLGHKEGDRFIQYCASKIIQSTRDKDYLAYLQAKENNPNPKTTNLVGRIGGDELAVLLIGSDDVGAVVVAERIRKNIAEGIEEEFPNLPWGGQTVCIGIAQASKVATALELFKQADDALYKAKAEEKKNAVVVAKI